MDSSQLINEWFKAIDKRSPDLNQLRKIHSQLSSPYVIDDQGRSALNHLLEKNPVPRETLIWLIGPEGQYDPFYPTFYLEGLLYYLKKYFPVRQRTYIGLRRKFLPIFQEFGQKYYQNQANKQFKYDPANLITEIIKILPDNDQETLPRIEETITKVLEASDRARAIKDRTYKSQRKKLLTLANLKAETLLGDLIFRYLDPTSLLGQEIGTTLVVENYNNLFRTYLKHFGPIQKESLQELKIHGPVLNNRQLWRSLETTIVASNPEALEILLDYGVDPNQYSLIQDLTILMSRSSLSQIKKVLDLLIRKGHLQLRPEILELAINFNHELKTIIQASQLQKARSPQASTTPKFKSNQETTDWMEICRSLDKKYKTDELLALAKQLDLPVTETTTKREICLQLALNFESFQSRLAKPAQTKTDRRCHNSEILEFEYDDLPDNQVIEFVQSEFKYCLSLDEIGILLKESQTPQNPFTREPLPESVIKEYRERLLTKPAVQAQQTAKRIHQLKPRLSGLAKIKADNKRLLAVINETSPYFSEARVLEMTPVQLMRFRDWVARNSLLPHIISRSSLKKAYKVGATTEEKQQLALNHILKSVAVDNYEQLGQVFDVFLGNEN